MGDQAAKGGLRGEGAQALAIAVAGLLGQVGCVTLILIAIALGVGLWLDTQFETRPLFTILFVLGSVPITLYLMVRMVLGGMNRLRQAAGESVADKATREE